MTIGKRSSRQFGNENIFIPGVQNNLNPVDHDSESFFLKSIAFLATSNFENFPSFQKRLIPNAVRHAAYFLKNSWREIVFLKFIKNSKSKLTTV